MGEMGKEQKMNLESAGLPLSHSQHTAGESVSLCADAPVLWGTDPCEQQ